VDYLTRIRISMAQRLLVTTDLKISEVACQSGFNTVCRFYIAFRQLCGQTPRKYRLAMRHMLAR
jgi:transcriptional regulator GlxA family with amidase domain